MAQLESLATRIAPTPEMVFAQKATAIVKAAGMNPRSIDLESFRKIAPLIFCRAYCAIYKENLITTVNENSSKGDLILNSQLVIDGLLTKTRNPALLEINGTDILQGNHRAIGIIVGVLFAEGQRLWLEKSSQVEAEQLLAAKESMKNISPAKQTSDNKAAEKTPEAKGGEQVEDQPPQDPLEDEDDALMSNPNFSEEELTDDERDGPRRKVKKRRSRSKQKAIESNTGNGVSERELDGLLNRITYLEDQLRKSKGTNPSSRPQSAGALRRSRSAKKGSHRRGAGSSRSRSPHEQRGTATNALLFSDESSDEGHKVLSGDDNAAGGVRRSPRRQKKQSRIAKLIESNQKAMSDAVIDQAQTFDKKHRPSSAPSTRKVRHVSARLYSAKNTREVLEIVNPQQTAAAIAAVTPPKPKKPAAPWDPEAPAPQYTYDLRSGRKVLLSQVEAEKLMRKQQRYASTNIMAGTEEDDYMGGGGGGGGTRRSEKQEPVRPEWPGKSTSRSVEAWVQKFKILREEHLYKTPEMPLAKSFAIYGTMEKLDVVISVEHCFNCQHHNISFRHDPAGYVSAADKFLRVLAQLVYENYLCVRVGVTRFPAAITAKSLSSDLDSRIGAFEIQIAARKTNGDVSSEMIHSKLAFKGWPSKSVLKKRLLAYLTKLNLPSYASKLAAAANAGDDSDEDDVQVNSRKQSLPAAVFGEVEYCSACSDPYPVGGCQWIETPLANPSWTYSSVNPNDTVDGIPAVQWVFDTRNLANPNKFRIGREVRVSDVRYLGLHPERLTLLGNVRENLNNKTLTVTLKYTNENVVVPLNSCILVSEYTTRNVQYSPDAVPVELEALLLLARQEKLIAWSVMNPSEDKKEGNKQFFLCRASFFAHIRKLSWTVENTITGRGARSINHPLSGQRVELQLAYSEEVLDWVFNRYHEQANMSDLEKTVKAKAAAHAAANPVAPAISKSDALYSSSSPAVMHQQQQHPVRAPSPGLAAPPATPVTVAPTVAPAPTPSAGIAADRFTPATTPARPEPSPAAQKPVAAPTSAPAPAPVAVAPTIKSPSPVPAPAPATAASAPPASSDHNTHSEHAKKPTVEEHHPTPAAAAPATTPPPPAAVHQHVIPSVHATVDQMNSLRVLMINMITTAQVGDDKSTGSQLSKMDIVELLSDALHQLTEEHGYEPVENYKSSHLLLDPEYKVALEVKVFLTCLEQFGLRVVTKHEPNVECLLGHFGQHNASDRNVVEVKIDMFIEWLLSGSLNKTRKSTKDLTIIATSPHKSTSSFPVTPVAYSAPPDSVRSDVSMDSQLQFSTTPHTAISTPAPTSVVPTSEPESPAPVPVALASVDPRQGPAAVAAPTAEVSNGSANDLADAEVLHINSARMAVTSPLPPAVEVPLQQPTAMRTVESESRNATAAPDTARESVGSASSKPAPDTRTEAEKAEAEALQELKERAKLEYQSKDLVFGSIIIEGEALEHGHYDTVMANLTIEDKHWAASVCLARERGSKRRSFNLSWGDILVKQESFREGNAYLSIVISDLALAEQHAKLPVLHSTQLGVSPHSVRIPLYKFMQPSFEIRSKVMIEPIIEGKAHPKGDVSIVIHGHAHEAKEARTSRIMSMKPQDLMKMKFEPLPVELDDDLLEDSDEDAAGFEDDFLNNSGNKKNLKSKSPQEIKEEKEVTSSLFPKASLLNLLSPASSTPQLPAHNSGAATPSAAPAATAAAAEDEDLYNDAFDD